MTTHSNLKRNSLLTSIISSHFYTQAVNVLRRTFLISLLIGLIWLPGLPLKPALALSSGVAALPGEIVLKPDDSSATEGDRLSAFISCLPKQLSQPSFKRALSEMSDDQLERVFNLKANPKLSQAEIELTNCMHSKGFTG
jgi:hypothetical protein